MKNSPSPQPSPEGRGGGNVERWKALDESFERFVMEQALRKVGDGVAEAG
jgi:hypothetical protein